MAAFKERHKLQSLVVFVVRLVREKNDELAAGSEEFGQGEGDSARIRLRRRNRRGRR
jgi:hypothetical protein